MMLCELPSPFQQSILAFLHPNDVKIDLAALLHPPTANEASENNQAMNFTTPQLRSQSVRFSRTLLTLVIETNMP